MIKAHLRSTIEDGNKALIKLRRVSEQALYPEQIDHVKFAEHHIVLAMEYVEKALTLQIDKEVDIVDEAEEGIAEEGKSG